eukprot:s1206_g24.t1
MRTHAVLIVLVLCLTSACLGTYMHAQNIRTQFASYFANLVGNTTTTSAVAGAPTPSYGATKPTELAEPSACGWKAPYACGCSNHDNDMATMHRILWNQTALELLNAGLRQPKYEKHTNYTFLQVHEAGFEELRSRFAALFENQTAFNISCEHVVIKVSIFPKTRLSRRKQHPMEHRIPDTDRYIGPKGCGIFVLSDWQTAAVTKTNGWNIVAFPTDDFLSNLTKIGNESTMNGLSNEIQRFFNILKITCIFLVPSSVKKVTFGDWKCKVIGFHQDTARSNQSNISDFEVIKHGTHFNKSLMKEFVATRGHIVGRQEWAAVRDMERLTQFLGPNGTEPIVNMPDIMCTTWHPGRKRQPLARFALRWFWYTAAFTMRPQLTYNLAMFDCGESLDARFTAAGQQQVFHFIDSKLSSEDEVKTLLSQLADIDLEYVANSLKSAQAEVAAIAEASDLEPSDDFMCLADASADDIAAWELQGLEAVVARQEGSEQPPDVAPVGFQHDFIVLHQSLSCPLARFLSGCQRLADA